jgi:hypothetical protein
MILPVSESHLPLHSEKKQSGISSLDTDKNHAADKVFSSEIIRSLKVWSNHLNPIRSNGQQVFLKLSKSLKKQLKSVWNLRLTPLIFALCSKGKQGQPGSSFQWFLRYKKGEARR